MSSNTRRKTATIITIFVATIALTGCSTLQGMLNGSGNSSTKMPVVAEPTTQLVMSYDPSFLGDGEPCVDSFCQFFSVQVTNPGDSPVDVYDDICLVADGKTYAENFDVTLSGTLNPGSSSGFDAAFRPASGAHVTELYLGNCETGTRIASLPLDYQS